MKYAIDTQSVIWATDDPKRLSSTARTLLSQSGHRRFVSVATPWEVAIKVCTKKLSFAQPYQVWMPRALAKLRVRILHFSLRVGEEVARLPLYHRDPFDRLLIAQAIILNIPIISSDGKFDAYKVTRIW